MANATSLLVLENSGSAFIEFMTGGLAAAGLRFHDNAGSVRSIIEYDHSNTRWRFYTEGANTLYYTQSSFAFQVATEIDVLGGDILFTERADPAAPAANKAVLYSKDDGAGKTQIVVRFPTGAVQVIATEP